MSTDSQFDQLMDPWDWSVDQVVAEFCRVDKDRPEWCSPTDRLPNVVDLERELRENDVTGEVVLTAISKEILRNDLNIKSMGQRYTIEKGINYLRSRSQKFQTSPAKLTIAQPFTPLQSWLHASGPPYDHPSNIVPSLHSAIPPDQGLDSPQLDLQLDSARSLQPHSLNARGSAQPLAGRASLQQTPVVETTADAPTEVAPQDVIVNIPSAPPQNETAMKVPRRIAPTFVAHLTDRTLHSAPLFGEEDTAMSRGNSFEEDHDERQFQILGSDVEDGQRILVSRWMKRYLSVLGNGPLLDNQTLRGLHVTGYSNDTNGTILQERQRSQEEDFAFRYLLDKYPANSDQDDALTLYGWSGDEGNFDEETWQEIDNDAAQDRNKPPSDRALTLQEVNAIIEEVIEQFISAWQDTRLAKVQAKGYRLWRKATREGRVGVEIATAQYWIQRLQQSVVKLRQALTRESWPNTSALRHQCQSLEPSIFQQEEHRYNISILRRMDAPPRPDRKSVIRNNPKPADLTEGEIALESESDLSMSNFIDNDNSEPLPIIKRHSAAPDELLSFQVLEDSDEVIPPVPRRFKSKSQNARVDPRKNPFLQEESSSARDWSIRADSSSSKDSSEDESDLDYPASLPKSRYEKVGHDEGMPIELMSSSDPPTPDKAHALHGSGIDPNNDDDLPPSTPGRITLSLPKAPLNDIEGIKRMAWDVIENGSDNRRALAKAVYSMSAGKAAQIRDFVKDYAKEDFNEVLQQGFDALLDRHTSIKGVAEDDWLTARRTTLLFMTYCLARRVLDERHLDKGRTLKAQGLVDSGGFPFLKELKGVLSVYPQGSLLTHAKRKRSDASSRVGDIRTSDSGSPIPQQTPGKKRHRRVVQSQAATNSQVAAQLRQQEMDQKAANMDKKFQNIPRNMMDPASYAIGLEEPVVYLDPKIGGKVKVHQVKGIRFMWRELITDENKQGCLLAHTMGLGKTMQVISILVTIAQSIKSPVAGIRNQIPRDLHDLKALILCPPSLIDNWYEEIVMWQPDPTILGGLYKITQRSKLPDRVQDIGQWVATGGILIVSYEMFRGLIVNRSSLKNGEKVRPLNDADHAVVQEHLLEHPNIIIADEAHKMKNAEASISMVTSRFKSKRRIALTGSPLANNLDEYFAMIDWIAPGYLGTKEQFSSKYAAPITEGLWNDSDMTARRISLRKLHVLKKNLDPKISRADITAIADDLPSKTEFFITVPLTKLQVKAYNLYVTSLLGGDEAKTAGTARLWDWLAILSLLCNHPSTFLTKLDDRKYGHGPKTSRKKPKKRVVSTDDVDGPGLPVDIELADAGLSVELIEQQRKIFESMEDSDRLEDPSLSHRSQLVCDIVEFSVAAGDKVLLFSHSLPTLDYLERMISSAGYSSCRLDGSTNVAKRQDAVKTFNKETATFNVFFISTRAGGLGLNLQGANRVILFDYGFNPIWEEQAIGRAYRLGQRKPVFVYRLRAGGTFEELIYNKAVFKTQLSARVVDKKNPMRYASRKATDYLFRVKELPQEDLAPYYGKDPLVLDQILSKSKSILDITLTETFQKEEDESLTPEEVKQANDELKYEQEKRRDPTGYGKKRAEHQSAMLGTPGLLPVLTAVRSSPYHHTFAVRPPNPSSHQSQQRNVPPTTPTQRDGYISRPEAIRSPQQTETGFWDHRTPPHLQSRLQNVLGLPPTSNISRTTYPSPTAENRPTEVRDAPGPPSQPNKLLDGAIDGDDENSGSQPASDAGPPECNSQ